MDIEQLLQRPAGEVPVAVLGTGTMGAGIAEVAALAGHPVQLYDARAGAAEAAVTKLHARLDRQMQRGSLSAQAAADARGRLQVATTLPALKDSVLAVEAIVEHLADKQQLLRELESQLPAHALIASNTSSLRITALAAALQRPQRMLGLHFFNPATAMALVEVVPGLQTAPALAEPLAQLMRRWGKVPVLTRDTPGFIVNRIARPFFVENLRLLEEGVADCATLDALLREAGGFRMGPFELTDFIGHDVNYAVTCNVFAGWHGDRRFQPSLRQQALVQAGWLGRKSGRGFHDYAADATVAAPQTLPTQVLPQPLVLHEGTALAQRLVDALQAQDAAFSLAPAHADARIASGPDFVLYRTDGRSATQRGSEQGVAACVVVDLAWDDARATRLAIAAADQAPSAAAAQAAGLLQAAGLAVSQLDDVPGLAVARSWAMLANVAADTVQLGICSAEAADLAMQHGANYPQGPLAWARGFGLKPLVALLDNLQAAHGEERYRVSPWLRRRAVNTP
ncbi:MAG TPA: 3-hydroxyacyl-CoA dehydrogenase [Stenotrophomonas sp.]|nr:3-hydroxyacyl-CoA dehydrogenase [Stenotrophomonas sp.]